MMSTSTSGSSSRMSPCDIRVHSALGYLTPAEFEQQWLALPVNERATFCCPVLWGQYTPVRCKNIGRLLNTNRTIMDNSLILSMHWTYPFRKVGRTYGSSRDNSSSMLSKTSLVPLSPLIY